MKIAAADLNGDGVVDFVYTDPASTEICVELRRGGQRDCYGTNNEELSPGTAAIGDLNDDDLLDLIVPNRGRNDVLVFLATGSGRFETARSFATGGQPTFVVAAEVTGDSIVDLVIANEGSNDVTVLRGQERGSAWTLVNGPRIEVGGGPVHLSVADVLSGDSPAEKLADLIVTNQETNEIRVISGRDGGYFSSDRNQQKVVQTGNGPRETMVLGRALVTINRDSDSLTHFDVGSGRVTEFASGGSHPVAGEIRKFNLDNDDDFVVAHENGTFSVFLAERGGFRLFGVTFAPISFELTDFALLSRGDGGFVIGGVGNGQSQLLSVTTFNFADLALETVDFLASVLFDFLPLSVSSIVDSVGAVLGFQTSFKVLFDEFLSLDVSVRGLGDVAGREDQDSLPPDEAATQEALDKQGRRILDDLLSITDFTREKTTVPDNAQPDVLAAGDETNSTDESEAESDLAPATANSGQATPLPPASIDEVFKNHPLLIPGRSKSGNSNRSPENDAAAEAESGRDSAELKCQRIAGIRTS